jgi:hypothetical protein
MTTDIEAPAAGPKSNALQRIAGVLFTPAATFAEIARRPDILGPLLLFLVVSYATTFIISPRLDWDAVTQMQIEVMKEKNPDLSDQDLERFSRINASMGKVMRFVGPALVLLMLVVIAGVLLLAVRLFGGEGNFKQALSTTLYGWIPMLISGIVLTIVAVFAGKVNPVTMASLVKSNPSFLVDMKEQPALFTLLSSIDVFTIWTILLLVFGFAALSRLSRGKTAAIIVTLFVVVLAVRMAIAALTAGLGS